MISERFDKAPGLVWIVPFSTLPFFSLADEQLWFWLLWFVIYLPAMFLPKGLSEKSMLVWALLGALLAKWFHMTQGADLLAWGRILLFLMTGIMYLNLNRSRVLAVLFQSFVLVLVAAALNYRFWMAVYLPVYFAILVRELMRSPGRNGQSSSQGGPYIRISFLLILLAYGLFLLFPRLRLAGLGNGASVSGLSDSIEFGEMTNLLQSERMVGRLISDRPIWLRGQVLDSFSGQRWFNSSEYRLSVLARDRDSVRLPYRPEPNQDSYEVEVDLLPSRSAQLPVPARATRMKPAMDLWFDAYGGVRRRARQTPTEVRYKVTAYQLPQNVHRDLPAKYIEHFLRLPNSLDPGIRALSEERIPQTSSRIKAARRLEGWFQREFTYALQSFHPNDPLAHFLLQDRRGHCEYFASAMAVMLRLRGIPARVVTGYAVSEFNEFGEYYSIRARDAHAWVEVLSRSGVWVEMDPTPAREESLFGSVLPALGRFSDFLDGIWQNSVLYYSRLDQMQFLLWLEDFTGIAASKRIFWLLSGALLILLFAYALFLWFQRRGPLPHFLLREFDRIVQQYGYYRLTGEGPRRCMQRQTGEPQLIELAAALEERLYAYEFGHGRLECCTEALEHLKTEFVRQKSSL